MDKQSLLQNITEAARNQEITENEVLHAFHAADALEAHSAKVGLSDILYYIGGGIIVLGISILVYQNWETLNLATKLLATLGAGVATFITAVLLDQREQTQKVSPAFFLISALVLPLGLGILLDNAGWDTGAFSTQTLMALVLSGLYTASYVFYRKNILLLFAIIFGTWLFYSITSLIMGSDPIYSEDKFFEYRTLVTGLSWGVLGYAFRDTPRKELTGFLYGAGSFAFLTAAIFLGGWEPDQSIVWELLFPLLVAAIIYASIALRSTVLLVYASVYLMIYILKITAEYFTTGLGWPLALVIAGLFLIAVGYASIVLQRRYMR